MILLIAFAFLGGIVTILSPCILPILPIILTGSVGNKKKPLGIVTGFILSFTFFTLFLTTIVKAFGISADSLRTLSVVIITLFGLSLILPGFQKIVERLFSKFASLTPKQSKNQGFWGGILIGLSLGLVWTPCVGPILASVISLALTGEVSGSAAVITLAYATGTGIPMLLITYAGQNALNRVPWLVKNTAKIQKAFGVIMILTAAAIFFNVDRKFQTYVLEKFPKYGQGLTSFEDNEFVRNQLDNINGEINEEDMGRPTNELQKSKGPQAPELIYGGQWFNSEPLKIADLRGKVVLVDFWTYTCINCIRTLPYLRDWHEKYSDEGLVIIGVHTPEFEFEKDPDNLAKAIEDFELKYPIVQDNDYATWRAYKNRYWPAKYLIDKDGVIRYTHFGEGKYTETEQKIQDLLSEVGADVSDDSLNTETYDVSARTPELYLGFQRLNALDSPETVKRGVVGTYTAPRKPSLHSFTLSGDWLIGSEEAIPSSGAKLELYFDAKEVYLVMEASEESTVKVYVDDEFVQNVVVNKNKLYEMVKLDEPGKHYLRLEFTSPTPSLFAFTFG